MNQFFKILLSFLSFFIFGTIEGLAFVETSENKNETLEEAEIDHSSQSIGNYKTKDFLHHISEKRTYTRRMLLSLL